MPTDISTHALQLTRSVHQGKLDMEHSQLIKDIQATFTQARARVDEQTKEDLAKYTIAK